MGKIKNLFIVDDSPMVIKQVTGLLKKYDFNVHTFTNPAEALESMTKTPPEIIILDYFMPEMSGETFMVKVSERLLNSGDWQVFLVSSHDFDHNDELAMQTLGITRIFKKPLNQSLLDQALAEYENSNG